MCRLSNESERVMKEKKARVEDALHAKFVRLLKREFSRWCVAFKGSSGS